MSPHEHYTGTAHSTIASGGLTNPGAALTQTSTELPSIICFLTREQDELYAVGGMGEPYKNYISKVDAATFKVLKKTSLDCPNSSCPANNTWAPSANVHANGFIYVSGESRLWKLDKDINIVGTYDLPIKQGAYNSLKVLADGNLLVKGFGIDGSAEDRSSLTILTPDLQVVVSEFVMPDKVYGRISTHVLNGVEYIYVTGATTLRRFRYTPGPTASITEDTTWSYTYRSASDATTKPGGLPTVMGTEVYFVDGAQPPPSTGPLSFYRVNLFNSNDAQKVTPWPGLMGGYHFNKHLVDPVNNVIVIADDPNGRMAGFRYQGGGNFTKLWERRISSKVIASASSQLRHLYTTDRSGRGESVVVLDIVTGQELARYLGSRQSVGFVGTLSIGANRDIFYNNNLNTTVRFYNQ